MNRYLRFFVGCTDKFCGSAVKNFGRGRMYCRCQWCKPARITGVKICARRFDGLITDGICADCRRKMEQDYGLEPSLETPQLLRRELSWAKVVLACLGGIALALVFIGGVSCR